MAQESPYAELNLGVAIPMQDFRANTDATGVGGQLNLLVPVGRQLSNLYLGLGGGYIVYGQNRQNEDLRAEITANGQLIDQLIIPLEVRTTNNIINGHALLRVQADSAFLVPYIQGNLGFRRIATDTRLYDRSDEGFFVDNADNDLITTQNNLSDWVFSYGGGAGLHFNFSSSVCVTLSANYLLGGRAEYYDADDTEQWAIEFTGSNYDSGELSGEDLQVEAAPRESRTDMLFVEIGLAFSFN